VPFALSARKRRFTHKCAISFAPDQRLSLKTELPYPQTQNGGYAMLIVRKPSANRLDIDLSAVLDTDMMAAGLDDLFDKSKDIGGGVMMYRILSFSMPTGGALAVEMMRLPQLFDLIGHFDRCAVLSDIAWIRTAAEVEGALIPGLQIKTFGLENVAAA
jgi:hypothetical protein